MTTPEHGNSDIKKKRGDGGNMQTWKDFALRVVAEPSKCILFVLYLRVHASMQSLVAST